MFYRFFTVLLITLLLTSCATGQDQVSAVEPSKADERILQISMRSVQYDNETEKIDERSFDLLNQVAQILINNPSLDLIIESDQDNGDAKTLASFEYLESKGVEKKRLVLNQEQESLPYAAIPEYPEAYTTGAVLGRLIDALGFRYYWATEGLRGEDRSYDPGGDNRSPENVLTHLYGLSSTIVNASLGKPNVRPGAPAPDSWEEKRKQTLLNLKKASDILKVSSQEEVGASKIIFQRGENKSSFNYWHMINGPITDAIYHVGQITSYRRSSGNPINPTVNVFMGTAGER